MVPNKHNIVAHLSERSSKVIQFNFLGIIDKIELIFTSKHTRPIYFKSRGGVLQEPPPPPQFGKPRPGVKWRKTLASFWKYIFFSIELFSNFSHMNVIINYVYNALKILSFSYLQFNCICGHNCTTKLYSKSKNGRYKTFFKEDPQHNIDG